jgi:PAS domain S-box-containing protein
MFTDITNRKQAEDALHRLNRQLRAISTCNQVLMQASDEQTLLSQICGIVCEEAGYRMAWVGYLQNDTDRTVRPVAWAGFEEGYLAEARITGADTAHGRGPTGRAIRKGVSACIQDFAADPLAEPWRQSALQRGYRSSTALPLKDENGTPFGALCIYSAQPGTFTLEEMKLLEELAKNLAFGICVLRTRAAQKQSEQELILRERQYRTLLESVPDFIVRYDLDLRLIYVNPAWEKATGLPAAQVLGLAHTDISRVPSPSVDDYTKKLRIAMETGASQAAEFTWVNAHGVKLFLEYVIVPEYDQHGKIAGVLAVGHDITGRKEAEEKIKESESKYMDLYENAPDMYISINAETALIEECNRTFLNTLGYSKKEIIGRPVFEIYHPDCLEKARETFRLFAKTGEVHDQELQLQKKDGSKLDVGLNVTSVQGEDGKLLFSRAILRDITERKRNNAINLARLHLMQFASTRSLDDFLEESLNEAEKITQSQIGFFVFVEDDQVSVTLQNWSTRTKTQFCKAEGKGLHYNISEAGIWVDCIIHAKPVIHNDYASLSHRKGMPEGHAELTRELVVPVLRGAKIKAVVGVGNKPGNYNETDVEAVSILADLTWEIAERKRAEGKMLRSDQRLRLHSEQSPLGFLEWDDHFCAIEWNAACERIFGYTRDEAIGRHAKDLILPVQVHELVDGIYQSLMRQTGGQHSINENVTKDGRIIICEWFNTTLINKDGKAIGVASVCRDITKQKQLEEELARHREHLEEQVKERTAELELARNKAQQYLDIAGVVLVAIDKNRRVALINQKGCEVLQGTSAEIIGKDWFETFIPQNQRQEVIKAFEQLMAGELEPVEYFENPVLTQDGRERLVAWHNVLLRDGQGHITGTLSSGEDITERRRAEKQVIRLNQDLQHRAVALEAVNKELDAFAYTVSHDLRAPLRHIDGFLELLQNETGTALSEQGRHYMDVISQSANKMGLLIDDLLSFSRMGRHAFSFQQVQMGPLVHDVIRELEPDAAGRTIDWRIGDLPSVNGDERMLRIVMTNLISNALKFTRTRPQARIEIGSLKDQESENVIFVRDNGVGFDMAYADKLFGVFQRLHRAEEFEGTGIGLASVSRIISRHGGRTWAQGEPGQGAAFYFTLPRTFQERKDGNTDL